MIHVFALSFLQSKMETIGHRTQQTHQIKYYSDNWLFLSFHTLQILLLDGTLFKGLSHKATATLSISSALGEERPNQAQ
jgi:hypothetical protein